MTSAAPDPAALQARITRFWGTHQVNFGRWFLSLPGVGQRMVLQGASPDMPEQILATVDGPPLASARPTDLLLPELNYDSLLHNGGRGLNVLFDRRAAASDAEHEDLAMLNELRRLGRMPTFSNGALDSLEISWVDPMDASEAISGLPPSATDKAKAAARTDIKAGALVDAEVCVCAVYGVCVVCGVVRALVCTVRVVIAF